MPGRAAKQPHLDHVLFRDLLRHDAGVAAEYATEKRRHAHLLPTDRAGYTDAKSAVFHYARRSRIRGALGHVGCTSTTALDDLEHRRVAGKAILVP